MGTTKSVRTRHEVRRARPISVRGESGPVLAAEQPEVVRSVPGEEIPRFAEEGLLPDVNSRAPSAASQEGAENIGWAKGVELPKLARRDSQAFESATWLHKAREPPKDEFQQAVERELTGKITEP